MKQSTRFLHLRPIPRLTLMTFSSKTVPTLTTDDQLDYRPLLMSRSRQWQRRLWHTGRPYD